MKNKKKDIFKLIPRLPNPGIKEEYQTFRNKYNKHLMICPLCDNPIPESQTFYVYYRSAMHTLCVKNLVKEAIDCYMKVK
jgi:hypothetical protein